MGRPKAADPERTRAKILDAAEEEFANGGFAGARVMAIADRAGVNHALLRYYFEDKERLYDTVVARLFERHLELVRKMIGETGSSVSPREFVTASFDVFWQHPNQVRIMLWELASKEGRVERSARPFFDALLAALPPLNPDRPANRCAHHDVRDVFTTLLGALVVYFFRDPLLEKLLGQNRFTEEDHLRRRAHLGALAELFF